MYKTELHCHSKEASPCSTESAESLIEIYTKAGYDTVVLTNHYSPWVYDPNKFKSIDEYVDFVMGAFKKMQSQAEGKLNVLFAVEIRFKCNANDYLCFGITEEFLRKTPDIFDFTPDKFYEICKQNGWLFIQAHPFRNGITVNNPSFLDGIEVYNGHIGHPERNFIAKQWAEEYNLIKTSGTDLHYSHVPASGGILTKEKITDVSQLIDILKSGDYELLTSDKVR